MTSYSFIFAVIGYMVLAGVSIFDKFILTKSLKRPAVYAFYSTSLSAIIFVLLPLTSPISLLNLIWASISGIAFGFGVWTMFIAVKHGESSHISPFIGATVAAVTFILSIFFLGEYLNEAKQTGLLLLISSCILLSYEKSRSHNGFHVGFLWAILSGTFFAVSHVSAKYIYGIYPFVTGLVWTRGTACVIAIIILLIPSVRNLIFTKHQSSGTEKTKPFGLGIVAINKSLGVFATFLIQYAIAIGSVTVVNAMAGFQYAFALVIIYIMTALKPKMFSEYFTKKELVMESAAIIMAAAGLIFLR